MRKRVRINVALSSENSEVIRWLQLSLGEASSRRKSIHVLLNEFQRSCALGIRAEIVSRQVEASKFVDVDGPLYVRYGILFVEPET